MHFHTEEETILSSLFFYNQYNKDTTKREIGKRQETVITPILNLLILFDLTKNDGTIEMRVFTEKEGNEVYRDDSDD